MRNISILFYPSRQKHFQVYLNNVWDHTQIVTHKSTNELHHYMLACARSFFLFLSILNSEKDDVMRCEAKSFLWVLQKKFTIKMHITLFPFSFVSSNSLKLERMILVWKIIPTENDSRLLKNLCVIDNIPSNIPNLGKLYNYFMDIAPKYPEKSVWNLCPVLIHHPCAKLVKFQMASSFYLYWRKNLYSFSNKIPYSKSKKEELENV